MERDLTDEAWRTAQRRTAQRRAVDRHWASVGPVVDRHWASVGPVIGDRIREQLPRSVREKVAVIVRPVEGPGITFGVSISWGVERVNCTVGLDLRLSDEVIAHLCVVV